MLSSKAKAEHVSGWSGVLTREQTLEALKIRKLFDQLVFATEHALTYLDFEGSERV